MPFGCEITVFKTESRFIATANGKKRQNVQVCYMELEFKITFTWSKTLKLHRFNNKILHIGALISFRCNENNCFQNLTDFAENAGEKYIYHILFETSFRKFLSVHITWNFHLIF